METSLLSLEVENDQRIHLQSLECYDHLCESDADINLLWGGRDSGKSFFIAQKLIIDSLNNDYFRCILIKKTHESIKDSQWQTIKDIVNRMGMSWKFTFLSAPLEIRVNGTDKKFIARGCDNPEKLKSIANPSCVWIEEGNQLTQDDYITITTSLRTDEGKVQEWISFNPETKRDYKDHWIYQDFFSWDDSKLNFTRTKEIRAGDKMYELTYTSTHTTYKDNPFCKPEQIARHENLMEVNPHRYRVFTMGLWGNEENDNPWAWALNRDKHYKAEPYHANPSYPIDISFDFNHDPCVCIVGQHLPHIPHIAIISYHKASSATESALKQLCDRIKTGYPHHFATKMMRITGDASGTQRDPSRPAQANRYTDICRHLGLGDGAVKIEKANITHKASRDLCNDILHQIPKGGYMFYGGQGGEVLLSEIEAAYPDDKESLNKFKKDAGGHGVDAWRYMNQLWFAHHLKGDNFRDYQKNINAFALRIR